MRNLYLALAAAALPALAWADASFTSGINTQASVSGSVTVSGKTELHLTDSNAPLANGTTVNLVDNDSWLFFNAVRPSRVVENFLPQVQVAGKPAVLGGAGSNVRVDIWGSGTVIIPNGNLTDLNALTVYDEIACKGNSTSFGCRDILGNNTHRVGLDTIAGWDNKIKSFTLKRGYMATFANNPDGTGHSRVYIADTDDVTVNILPEGFVTYTGSNNSYDDANTQTFISFVRVSPWRWVSKKGWGGWSDYEIALSGADSYYVWLDSQHWDADPDNDFYPIDYEFVPIKQNRTDPKWYQLDTITNVSHLLGYNEPDRPDQSNLDADYVISEWYNMFRTGLRIGSPACSGIWIDWNSKFWKAIEKYNYRCDYAVTHIYEYTSDWKSRLDKSVEYSKGRPFWVTEYNNGANWTTEKWPDGTRDASATNLEHQRQWTAKMMDIIENLDGLERAYYYNWVQDCRAYILNGKLTPAGEIFHNYVSAPGYKAAKAYNHTWKIAPPYSAFAYNGDATQITATLYDHNGETGKEYVVEGFTASGWSEMARITADKYTYGDHIQVTFPTPAGVDKPIFRAYAISYKGEKSDYSDSKEATSPTLGTPLLSLAARNGSVVKLQWTAVDYADFYRLRRGNTRTTVTKIIVGNTTETEYRDETVTPETEYFYQVGCKNSFNDFKWSTVLRVYTGTESAGIASVDDDVMKIRTEGHNLVVECDVDCIISIVAMDGRVLRNIEAAPGITTVSDLAPGIYLVNDKKVVIR